MDEIRVNRWMLPDRTEPFATLIDGTPLYPAHHPLHAAEAFRRRMGMWTGQTGEWVGVTLDGRLYRQARSWGGETGRAEGWERFTVTR